MGIYNLISLLGLIVLTALGYLLSNNRREINWHVVVWGIGLQMLFAWFLFVFPVGIKLFYFVNDAVVAVLNSAQAGTQFVFGRLAINPGATGPGGETSLGFILAFQAFPTIIFFSALMSILYYLNIMPRLIKWFSYLFTKLMRVSGAEALCTASNIFVGVESAFTIRPFLKDMTRSELCTVLTAGMATVSSNIMAVYVFSLKDVFPSIAGHLVSASILSAPAALMMSKLLLPETEKPRTLNEHVEMSLERDSNLFEAIINGAQAGVKLIVGIVALLIAVLGLVALADQGLVFLGGKINQLCHIHMDWSIKGLLGIIFYPFVMILGVPPADGPLLAKIIGERAVVTEVVAYKDLADAMAQGLLSSPRSAVIATYALCGFAHIASLAIFIGGTAAIVPEKIKVLSEIGFRALVAATLACLLTAAVAGIFFTGQTTLLGFE